MGHTGHGKSTGRGAPRGLLLICATAIFLLAFAPPSAFAAPSHPRLEAQDITGLNHACGAAVDSEGDVYAASAGESKVKVFNAAHTLLKEISNANEPCGLAVDSQGNLYVSEAKTGNVVRYHPTAYPFVGTPSYEAPKTIDSSGKAKGISVDTTDDRLYVAEGNRVASFQRDGTTGQDEMQEVGVANTVTGGTFTLEFGGQSTAPITVVPSEAKPSNAELRTALESLSTIGVGNVTVEEGAHGLRTHRVVFTGSLASQDVAVLKADSSGLSGGSVFVEPGIQGFASTGLIGEGQLSKATAIAVYTYEPGSNDTRPGERAKHYLSVADSATDEVDLFSGPSFNGLVLEGKLDGTSVPDSEACPNCSEGFGFGAGGAALGLDRATGHLFVYDAAHGVLDEFEATGHYLDQVVSPEFADAGPAGVAMLPERSELQELTIRATGGSFKLGFEGQQTASLAYNATASQIRNALAALPAIGTGNVVVSFELEGVLERVARVAFAGVLAGRNVAKLSVDDSALSGGIGAGVSTLNQGFGPGRLYVGAGGGAGAKLLAFGPLPVPSRAGLGEPLSHGLAGAGAVATDSEGYVYVAAGSQIHVYRPDGTELTRTVSGEERAPIEDTNHVASLAVDSTGHVYVYDKLEGMSEVTYYTPSSYPPVQGTVYVRHEPAIFTQTTSIRTGMAVNTTNDHLFFAGPDHAIELDSAEHGSAVLNPSFGGLLGSETIQGIAVDGVTGDVYVSSNPGLIRIMDPTGKKILASIHGEGSPKGPWTYNSINSSIAVDESNGHVLSFDNTRGVAEEYDSSGAFVAEYGGFTKSIHPETYGIAFDNSGGPGAGRAYIGFDDTKKGTPDLWAFGPLSYGEAPAAVTGVAAAVGGDNATLNGSVNPRGFTLALCQFEYLTDVKYQQNGKTFAGATATPCAQSLEEIGNGSGPVAVSAGLSGLDPEERYRFRLRAENGYGESTGKAGVFGLPVSTTGSARPIFYAEATLHGEVDPSGLNTRYWFEYGTEAGVYTGSTPVQQLVAGDGAVTIQAPVAGLQEGNTYHFRLTAENEAGTMAGPDHAFTTLAHRPAESCSNAEYRTGFSVALPDCRAYELVSPGETRGAILGSPSPGTASAGFNRPLTPLRGPGAGEALTFASNATLPGFDGTGGSGDNYRADRAQGSHPAAGWTSESMGPNYAQANGNSAKAYGSAPDQLYSLWRIDAKEAFEGSFLPGFYLRVPSGSAGPACNPYPDQASFELLGCGSLGSDKEAEPSYVGSGGSHVVFTSKAHLQASAAPVGTQAIYDRAAGSDEADVVSVKPGGASFGAGEGANYLASTEDGSATAFRVGGVLYLHREGQTVEVATAPNTFAGLSEDGERVFYAAATSGTAAAPLYVCDVAQGPCAGAGAHAAVQIGPSASEAVFVAVSPDGSHVFFASTKALTGSEENEVGQVAEAGKRNLYAWSDGTTRFLAVLDPMDFVGFGDGGKFNGSINLGAWTEAVTNGTQAGRADAPVRSTPDGAAFVFQSHARLTAYDNGGHGEIYRYSADAEEGERLACVSCDPSGAPPAADALLEQITAPLDKRVFIPNITDSGAEVFFQTADPLLPEDANDAIDVYEWQAKGVDSCGRDGGCLALVSSGQDEKKSVLFSMSADGRDVFFITIQKLVGADVIGSFSLYDAREGGGIPDVAQEAPCQGDACQGNGSEPPGLPSPTTTGPGGGNVEEPSSPPPCAKGKRRIKGRCVIVHKHRHKQRHRRANRNRRAVR